MASAKPGQKIPLDKLQATLVELEKLSEKPKEELSLRESIYFLREKLRLALKRGYSYQDLSELLEQQEILISAATLKQYLTEIEKESASNKRTAKSVKAKQASTGATSPEHQATIRKTSAKDSSGKTKENLPEPATAVAESDVTESESKLNENLRDSERETPLELDKVSSGESQQKTGKAVKRKNRGGASSSTDLSSEFNQY